MADEREDEIAALRARLTALEGEAAKRASTPPQPSVPPPASVASPAKPKSGCSPWAIGGLAVFALFIIVVAINTPSTPPAPTPAAVPATPTDTTTTPPTAEAAAADNWTYTQTKDEMHDTEAKTACTTSTNSVQLDAPYSPTDARLCIRRSPRFGLDVYVELNGDGQILCEIYTCNVHVRFDQEKPLTLQAAGAADGSSNIIFFRNNGAIISHLKHAQRTIVALQYYQAGVQDLTFNTGGLSWP